jgi:DNA-directed RNA polymerase specialized sigma24 family protein
MKINVEDWDDSLLDVEDYQAERALTNAALDAIRRARRFGTDFVVEEEGKPRSLKANQTAPYEKRLLEDLDRINRKIAELQQQSPNALALNERPEPPSQKKG